MNVRRTNTPALYDNMMNTDDKLTFSLIFSSFPTIQLWLKYLPEKKYRFNPCTNKPQSSSGNPDYMKTTSKTKPPRQ